jgi:hypothetical protein
MNPNFLDRLLHIATLDALTYMVYMNCPSTPLQRPLSLEAGMLMARQFNPQNAQKP